MGSVVDEPERGDEGFEREALPAAEAWSVAARFSDVVNWQVNRQTTTWVLRHWETGSLVHENGEVYEARLERLLAKVWVRVKPPRGGWGWQR